MNNMECSADGGGATPYCLMTAAGSRCVQCLTQSQCPAGSRGCFNNRCF
jgi:hypothetical protein